MENNLTAINNIKTSTWEIAFENILSNEICICIGFFDPDNKSVVFQDLSFGFSIIDKDSTQIVLEEKYPKGSETYIETDQKYLLYYNCNLKFGRNYNFKIWSKNASIHSENSHEFSIPIPDKPHKSWSWNGDVWESPKPYPNDGLIYVWDEENQQWIVNKNIPTAGTHYLDQETGNWILVPQYELS